VVVISFAAEGGDTAIRRGDFAIGGHRHIHEYVHAFIE